MLLLSVSRDTVTPIQSIKQPIIKYFMTGLNNTQCLLKTILLKCLLLSKLLLWIKQKRAGRAWRCCAGRIQIHQETCITVDAPISEGTFYETNSSSLSFFFLFVRECFHERVIKQMLSILLPQHISLTEGGKMLINRPDEVKVDNKMDHLLAAWWDT